MLRSFHSSIESLGRRRYPLPVARGPTVLAALASSSERHFDVNYACVSDTFWSSFACYKLLAIFKYDDFSTYVLCLAHTWLICIHCAKPTSSLSKYIFDETSAYLDTVSLKQLKWQFNIMILLLLLAVGEIQDPKRCFWGFSGSLTGCSGGNGPTLAHNWKVYQAECRANVF